ncbi:MAG: class I SAM-dependent methyltransferase [Candidatus Sulfotelmatobacter sp.]
MTRVNQVETQPACHLCGAATRASRFARYCICQSCGLVQADRAPSDAELAHYYTDAFEVNHDNYLQSVARRAGPELDWLEGFVPGGRLLEVGCSWGKFMDVARDRGWKVSGVELSAKSSTSARNDLQLDVFTGKLEDSPFVGTQAFDLVISWHVIEHVPDPLSFLRACRSCLRPGGYLVLKTPNVASLVARLNRGAWSWANPVSHLVLFSPKTLGNALEKSGFQVKQVLTRRGDANHPWLEVARGTAIKFGLHGRVKSSLNVEPANGDQFRGTARGISLLNRINRGLDVGLFWLWPVEGLLDRVNMGPELRTVAVAV